MRPGRGRGRSAPAVAVRRRARRRSRRPARRGPLGAARRGRSRAHACPAAATRAGARAIPSGRRRAPRRDSRAGSARSAGRCRSAASTASSPPSIAAALRAAPAAGWSCRRRWDRVGRAAPPASRLKSTLLDRRRAVRSRRRGRLAAISGAIRTPGMRTAAVAVAEALHHRVGVRLLHPQVGGAVWSPRGRACRRRGCNQQRRRSPARSPRQLRAERALREDRLDPLALDQGHQVAEILRGGLGLSRLRGDDGADHLDPVAIGEVAERVVIGDQLARVGRHRVDSSGRCRGRGVLSFAR